MNHSLKGEYIESKTDFLKRKTRLTSSNQTNQNKEKYQINKIREKILL